MSHVVCNPCHDCKYTDCVTVCPCDCFYEDENQLYIDPEDCIDCCAAFRNARLKQFSSILTCRPSGSILSRSTPIALVR